MTDLHELSALEQAAAVRRGDTSALDLVDAALARLERLSPTVGAFVTVTADAAREQARAMDARVREARDGSGRVAEGALPALCGVPTGIKDLNLTDGVRTMLGSASYADFVPPLDDNVVTALRAAGVISLGKTNTPEFGLPCYTEPDVAPPARTPWDLDRGAGGSSGGAAAAVAAGIVPFAQGSDGGGSIRIPASVCGVVGVKPTRGRVSLGPIGGGDAAGLVVNGSLARTVADAAALLDAMSGYVVGDPTWAPPPAEPFLASARREPGRLRIGRWCTPPVPGVEVHPECLAAWEDTSRLLTELGHEVEDVPPPFGPETVALFETIWTVAACGVPVDPEREGELRPLTRWLRGRGQAVTASDYTAALTQLRIASREAIAATDGFDAVLVPTLASPPVRVGSLRDDADPAADFAAQTQFTPYTAVYNVTGQPAFSLPLRQTPEGLPVGVMLAGRPAGESVLFSLAAQLEAARPWRDRHPPLWE